MKLHTFAWLAAAVCLVQGMGLTAAAEEESRIKTEESALSTDTESSEAEERISGDYEYTVDENGDATITDYLGQDTEIVVPETLEGCTVVGLGSGAFALLDTVTSITLPETLKTLSDSCFYGTTALETIEVAEGNTAFQVQDGVLLSADGRDLYLYPPAMEGTSYTVPDGVLEIWSSSFSNTALTEVTFPDGLLYIDEWAFGWTPLGSLELPDSLLEIGQYAFAYCTDLTEVTFPDSLELIEAAAFAGDSALEQVTFSDAGHLTEIQMAAFAGTAMREVTIPSSVTYIGFCAFGYEEDMETPVDDFVIYGAVGSQAERYCTDEDSENNYSNNFTFQSVMSEEVDSDNETVEVEAQSQSVWQTYGRWILLGVAAVVLLVIGAILLLSNRKPKTPKAEPQAAPAPETAAKAVPADEHTANQDENHTAEKTDAAEDDETADA